MLESNPKRPRQCTVINAVFLSTGYPGAYFLYIYYHKSTCMALISMGTIVTKIRGKVQGSVFSGNIAGDTLRNKTIPRRANTQIRSAVNNQWKFLSQEWLKLNTTQRGAWSTYATNFTFYNKLGAAVAARNNLVFNVTNLFYYEINGVILDTPVSFTTPPSATHSNTSIRRNTQDAVTSFTSIPSDVYIDLFCSPPFRLGKDSIMKNRITKIFPLTIINSGSNTVDFSAEFWGRYPWAIPGQVVWVAWRRVEPNCFAWSPFEYFLATVTN